MQHINVRAIGTQKEDAIITKIVKFMVCALGQGRA